MMMVLSDYVVYSLQVVVFGMQTKILLYSLAILCHGSLMGITNLGGQNLFERAHILRQILSLNLSFMS